MYSLYLRVGHRGTTACARTSALRLRTSVCWWTQC